MRHERTILCILLVNNEINNLEFILKYLRVKTHSKYLNVNFEQGCVLISTRYNIN